MSGQPAGRELIAGAARTVVKVGSSSLTSRGRLQASRLDALVDALAARRTRRPAGGAGVLRSDRGRPGAAGAAGPPRDLATQQAAASVGQLLLAERYAASFARYGLTVGQVLLTAEDLHRRGSYRNAVRTLERLLALGVIPIVNENDTVATHEIRFGDNDRLAALVAHLVRADALVLLSDIEGLYTADPRRPGATLVPEITDPAQLAAVRTAGTGSGVGTGGMSTKIDAALIAGGAGIPVLLAHADTVAGALAGEGGTYFTPPGQRTATRLLWLRHATTPRGRLLLDAGAVAAVVHRRASLLAAGITGSHRRVRRRRPGGAGRSGRCGAGPRAGGLRQRRPARAARQVQPGPARRAAPRGRAPRRPDHPVADRPTLEAMTQDVKAERADPGEAAVRAVAQRAREASFDLALLTRADKDRALHAMADALDGATDELLDANAEDVAAARADGTAEQLVDRLALTVDRLAAMADGLREIAALPDPVGEVVRGFTRPNGLELRQLRVPFGVVAMVYEARPNVTVDAAGLTLKSGNAALLRGSASAIRSNRALVAVLSEAAAKAGLPADAVQLVPGTDRSSVGHLLRARGLVDVAIPRGGAGLIRYVVDNAEVPVIETGTGNVHVYVDAAADLEMAERIVLNAKVSRPSVCNAAETLLVHRAVAAEFVPRIVAALHRAGRAGARRRRVRGGRPRGAGRHRRRLADRVPRPRPGRPGGGRRRRGDRPHPALVVGPLRGDRHR